MRRILVLFAHPVLERSRVNRRLLSAVRDVPGVTVHDLYDVYPTLYIDAKREQRLLLDHDVVVFQHPFYWYSTPAILKEWQDLVLEHGWAYGRGGTQLRGKITMNAITTGGPAAAYRRDGYNRFTIRELLAPWDQTAHLCGMRFLAPFAVHATLRVAPRTCG
jgi:glutathione-regulated potassium-efflux system ancillary protein KefG